MTKDVEDMRELWPQLTAKLAVDLANGLVPARELHRVRSERTGLLQKLGAVITGRDSIEQRMIEAALLAGQENIVTMLGVLQDAQVESDYFLAEVATRLGQLRRSVNQDVEALTHRILALEHDRQLDRERLDRLTSVVSAQTEMNRVLGDAAEVRLPPLALVFMAVDRLWWGSFGAFLRNPGPEHARAAENLSLEATRGLTKLLARSLHLSSDTGTVDVAALSTGLQALTFETDTLVRFLAQGADDRLSPLHALLSREEHSGSLPLALPRRTSVERVASRLWSEARWVAENRVDEGRQEGERK